MFIVTLKKNGIVNSLNCIAFRQSDNVIVALTSKNHPDCPHVITLAKYSTEDRAKQEFERFVEAMKLGKKYYEMTEEIDGKGSSN